MPNSKNSIEFQMTFEYDENKHNFLSLFCYKNLPEKILEHFEFVQQTFMYSTLAHKETPDSLDIILAFDPADVKKNDDKDEIVFALAEISKLTCNMIESSLLDIRCILECRFISL